MKCLFFAVFILAFFTIPADAAFYTGNELLQQCSVNRPFLTGFVAGVFDKAEIDQEILLYFSLDTIDTKNTTSFPESYRQVGAFCPPSGIVLGQAADIFCQFLVNNPAIRQKSGAVLVNEALAKAWPCRGH